MSSDLRGPTHESVLVEAFQRILGKTAAFSLVVSDGTSERIFYFAIGGVRIVRSGPRRTPLVGEVLIQRGKLVPDDLERIQAECRERHLRFGEAAVRLGLLQPEDVLDAVQEKVEEELLDLFLWEGAEVSLTEGQPPKAFYELRHQAASLGCDVPQLLQKTIDRVHGWHEVVSRLPEGREVFELTERGREDVRGPFGRLFGLLDGTRTLAEAFQRSSVRRVPAWESLLDAIADGRVRRATGGTAQKVTRDELLREIEGLEDALRFNVDANIVRTRLARTLEQAGEPARAAAQWKFLGDRRRRQNDLSGALAAYREAVRVLPTDFATRELILEIHRHRGEYGALVSDGRPLADLFLRHNLLNRARALLLQLVGIEPTDGALRRQLVMVLLGLGERELALKHLRDLAAVLEERGAAPGELKDTYVRILALDGRDAAARRRLDKLTGAAMQRTVLRATVGGTAAVLLGLLVVFGYEGKARREIRLAVEVASAHAAREDYAGARAAVEAAVERYGMSRASASGASFLRSLEHAEAAARARQEVRGAERGRDPESTAAARAELAAQALADRAAALLAEGRVTEGHRVYGELLVQHPEAEVAKAVRLPLSVHVLPADARVLLNGEELGQGTVSLEYAPAVRPALVVERKGFAPFRKELDGPLDPVLEVHLHRPLRWTWRSDAAVDAQPLVTADSVYVAGRDRYLTALSPADGSVRWRVPLGLYSDVAVRPAQSGSAVIAATATGEAVCVDGRTGSVLWRRLLSAGVDRPAAQADAAVVVSASDGSVVALDPQSGKSRWERPRGSAPSGAVTVLPGGDVAWIDGRGTLARVSPADGSPRPVGADGAVLHGTPVADPERVWCYSAEGALRVLSVSTGTELRRLTVPMPHVDVPPVVGADGVAYVACLDGGIVCYRSTGEPVFRERLPERAAAAPAAAGDRLYVPGSRGTLYVLDAATGALLWRHDAGAPLTSTPVVRDGTVYVTTAAGAVLAFEE